MSVDVLYAELYCNAYYIFLLLLTLVVAVTYSRENRFCNRGVGYMLAVLLILYMAFRPLTYVYFGDTQGYAFFFRLKYDQAEIDSDANDYGFELISFALRHYDVVILFLVMGAIYVIPQLMAAKRLSPKHFGLMMLIIVCSFSFFSYGVNGMRNGAALALVMLGMVIRKPLITAALFIVGYSIHGSALLPIAAYCLSLLYNRPKFYIITWCVCVVLSFAVADMLTDVIPLSDFIEDDRVDYLKGSFDNTNATFSSTGFRWDFLLYSAVPIYIGGKYLAKNFAEARLYSILYNVYMICNAFWLFTIYIPYNNRFAYLSWFLYPVIISYPFLKNPAWGTSTNLKLLVLLNYSFTFIMYLL